MYGHARRNDQDHPSAATRRPALDRPRPRRGRGQPRHGPRDRHPLLRPLRVSLARDFIEPERIAVGAAVHLAELDRFDPHEHGRAGHQRAGCDDGARTDDRSTAGDESADTGADHRSAHTRSDEDALGAAQLLHDRRELVHRLTRDGDVREPEPLAALAQDVLEG